jgi:hypothetical protein
VLRQAAAPVGVSQRGSHRRWLALRTVPSRRSYNAQRQSAVELAKRQTNSESVQKNRGGFAVKFQSRREIHDGLDPRRGRIGSNHTKRRNCVATHRPVFVMHGLDQRRDGGPSDLFQSPGGLAG